jgi:hypothetical protein
VRARSAGEIDVLAFLDFEMTTRAELTTKRNRLPASGWRHDIFLVCLLASDFCLAFGLCNALKHIPGVEPSLRLSAKLKSCRL